MAALAKRCYDISDLSPAEKTLLGEFARGESDEPRYKLKTLRAFARITARSRDVAVREGLAEIIRGEVSRAETDLPENVTEAFDDETPAPGLADPAQRAFEQDPNPITWRRCYDALLRQFGTTRRALNAMLRVRPAN